MTHSQPQSPYRYYAYMLRMGRYGTLDFPVWRFSLEDPHTGEVLRFQTFEALVAFLRTQLEGVADEAGPPDEAPTSNPGAGERRANHTHDDSVED